MRMLMRMQYAVYMAWCKRLEARPCLGTLSWYNAWQMTVGLYPAIMVVVVGR